MLFRKKNKFKYVNYFNSWLKTIYAIPKNIQTTVKVLNLNYIYIPEVLVYVFPVLLLQNNNNYTPLSSAEMIYLQQ